MPPRPSPWPPATPTRRVSPTLRRRTRSSRQEPLRRSRSCRPPRSSAPRLPVARRPLPAGRLRLVVTRCLPCSVGCFSQGPTSRPSLS
jgi:hypothetical protein